MSKVIATSVQVIPTMIGNMHIQRDLIQEYDVEDLARANAGSQAKNLQMVHIGSMVQSQPSWPAGILPSAFQGVEDVT